MASYVLLDQAEEDALHKSRLLNVEEKPFKRITKRLLASNTPISKPQGLPPTPPPDDRKFDENTNPEKDPTESESTNQKQLDEHRQFREDVLLDFAAFESSIVRIQFLLTSNAQERERYAAEKLRIQAAAQEVRDNTTELRVQLEEAQSTLALRKTYDELAEKITNNRLLRPREDQHANLEKLNAEIADLERESKEYAQTWAERRQQFDRIIEEGMHLRRLIRDEKEEVERREGMQEREDGEDVEHDESISRRGRSSGAATPMNEARGGTPGPGVTDHDSNRLVVNSRSTPRGKSPLRSSEKAQNVSQIQPEATEDVNMVEDGEVDSETAAVAAPAEGLVSEDDGGDAQTRAAGDQMDTS